LRWLQADESSMNQLLAAAERLKRAQSYRKLLEEFERLARSAPDAEFLMQRMANRLREASVRFNWVGFYLVDTAHASMLRLGPFTGIDTPYREIPFDKGICGVAASTGSPIVVPNVKDDPRYLPDSEYTRSEIVLPIFVHRELAGVLAINSFFEAAFEPDTQEFLEQCVAKVSEYVEDHKTALA
jgi:L-methionine (R)-S-oxide reductase